VAEYLAPGVYVEETSFRAKSIEGVGTSTAAFVGPALRGPEVTNPDDPDQAPELLTSYGDFERIYGGTGDLLLGTAQRNHLALAVQAFFNNGGARLYVSRVSLGGATASAPIPAVGTWSSRFPGAAGNAVVVTSLRAQPAGRTALSRAVVGSIARLGGAPVGPDPVAGGAFPLNLDDGDTLTITVTDGTTPVSRTATFRTRAAATLSGVAAGLPAAVDFRVAVNGVEAVITLPAAANIAAVTAATTAALASAGLTGVVLAADNGVDTLTLTSTGLVPATSLRIIGAPTGIAFADVDAVDVGNAVDVNAVTLAEVQAAFASFGAARITDAGGLRITASGTQYTGTSSAITATADPAVLTRFGIAVATHSGSGGGTSYFRKDATQAWLPLTTGALDPNTADPASTALITLNVQVTAGDVVQYFEDLGLHPDHGRYLPTVLSASPPSRRDRLTQLVRVVVNPGVTPTGLITGLVGSGTTGTFTLTGGTDGASPVVITGWTNALASLNRRDDISIVGAPGYAAFPAVSAAIQDALVGHVEQRRIYRIAILETPEGLTPGEARDWRGRVDSTRAALYYPWIITSNPNALASDASQPREIAVPPTGSIAGVYARTDILRGVYKAPANEVVRGALRFEYPVNFAEQELLNPAGVNALRFFPGRGYRVWGARTVTSDPEWKYVPVRRYFLYLESSIERGTQWAVFEPNGERLWANLRETIDAFLFNEWKNGALLGATPKEAYFVKIDRSTMTQNDIDNGRLVALIGVAPLRPAEFVIFRIGQKTADARD
jgi:phage tail sheath protein FI